MREIKFKANIKGTSKVFDVTHISFIKDKTVVKTYDSAVDEGIWFDIDEVELLQYTGLKDKDGAEIYEGYVVENVNGEIGYVAFLAQESGFVIVLKNRDYRLGHRNTGEGYNMAGNHKVIGNIYENPELLEREAE